MTGIITYKMMVCGLHKKANNLKSALFFFKKNQFYAADKKKIN